MASTPEEIADAISDNAAGPKAVSADGISVTQQNIADQILAENHAKANQAAAAARPGLGLRVQQIQSVYR